MSDNITPYHSLGDRLRGLREHMRETVHEVSDAVEIESKALQQIEAGKRRPSEDILLLLCSHFQLEDTSTEELWKLAGYTGKPGDADDDDDTHDEHMRFEQTPQSIQAVMMMLDPRVIYSDGVEAIAGDRGVTLHFSQMNGPGGKPLVVSRIGMSRVQAEQLMGVLHQVLYNLDNPGKPQLGDGIS